MSRARRSRSLSRSGPLLDLTPMVDVVFTLVIFFMVSTTFISLESGLPIDLPQAQNNEAQSAEQPTVTITGEGRIYLAGAEIDEAGLVTALRPLLADRKNKTVVMRADQSVAYGLPVRVMDLIKQAGADRVAIATGGN